MKAALSILVLCEDVKRRMEAVAFCDRMVQRFWTSCEFDINWVSYRDLADPGKFRTGVKQAASAGLLIFAMRLASSIPPEVEAWMEAWLIQRGEKEGSLIALGDPGHIASAGISQNFVYLRGIARRGALDYLTEMPEKLGQTIPDGIDAYPERAQQMTSVLDQILRRKIPAPFRV